MVISLVVSVAVTLTVAVARNSEALRHDFVAAKTDIEIQVAKKHKKLKKKLHKLRRLPA